MLKKLAPAAATISYFLVTATTAFAQAAAGDPSKIVLADPGVGYRDLTTFINAAIRLAFIIALVAVLVMLVWGAVQWIFSGGEKEAVANARNRIIHALIGLAILAVAVAIVAFAGQFVGINILRPEGFTIPTPDVPTPALR